MIYIVCPNVDLGKDYVRKEIPGSNPDDRIFQYITSPVHTYGIVLHVGDKVHKISTNEYPMTWQLYEAWLVVERTSGLPTQATPPYLH